MSVTSPGYGFPSHFSSHSRRTCDYRAARDGVHVHLLYVYALDAACLRVGQGAMCWWRGEVGGLVQHVGG